MPKELFDIFAKHPFDGNHCFLCGVDLNPNNRTIEHVFPRWLQDAFDLRDRSITLLNGTRIPYRSLVIPCCKQCNGTHLSQLEGRMRPIILDYSKSLDQISDQDMNSWVSKIYIGVLWRELELKFDRRTQDSEPILPKEAMENFRMVHFLMQSCRKKMTFYGNGSRFPNSLLRVECKVPNDIENRFDYLDNFSTHTVAIRMGSKGIVGIFDGGLHDLNFPDFADRLFERKPLHPDQFKEVFVKLTYKNSLSLRVPYFGITQNREIDEYTVAVLAFDDHSKCASCLVVGTEDGPISMIPLLPESVLKGSDYSDWCQEDFARCLSMYTGIPVERIFVPPDMVRTSLRDSDGNFLDIPIESPIKKG
jgi:hypothetical protein